jgi:hypothetical protein
MNFNRSLICSRYGGFSNNPSFVKSCKAPPSSTPSTFASTFSGAELSTGESTGVTSTSGCATSIPNFSCSSSILFFSASALSLRNFSVFDCSISWSFNLSI